MLIETTRYELPPEGISLLGYIVRRMHKTEWLTIANSLIGQNDTTGALEYAAVYAAAASSSFGPAYYQPDMHPVHKEAFEIDPATGALITAKFESITPKYVISYNAQMLNGDTFEGSETITGTTIGFRGLGMPAPSRFRFTSGSYKAEIDGTITSELALAWMGNTRVRAYGFLNLKDNKGNTGQLELDREGTIRIHINGRQDVTHSVNKCTWVDSQFTGPQTS